MFQYLGITYTLKSKAYGLHKEPEPAKGSLGGDSFGAQRMVHKKGRETFGVQPERCGKVGYASRSQLARSAAYSV